MKHWFWPAFQREIRASWKKLSLSALTLCIGMASLSALLLADARLELQTRRQADAILGADAEISDVRLLPEGLLENLQTFNQISRKSRVTSFVTMVMFPQNSRAKLSEVLAVDDSFPLVPGMKVTPFLSFEKLRSGGVLIEKGLADTFGIQPHTDKLTTELSDKAAQRLLIERKAVRIGKRIYPVVGVVENDQMRDFASFSLGSRLYMARDFALRQKLISPQSRLRDKLLLQFSAQSRFNSVLQSLREEINKYDTSKIVLRSKEDALNSAFKPARSLFLFFNAIGFSALLLLGLGSAQGIHSYLNRKLSDAAILSNLGAPRSLLTLLFVGNVVFITLTSLAIGAWLGQFLFHQEISPRLSRWFVGEASDVSLTSHTEIAFKFTTSAFLLILSLILPGALSFLRRSTQKKSLQIITSSSDSWPKKAMLTILALLEKFPDLVWLFTALLLSFFVSGETGFNLILVSVLAMTYLVIRMLVSFISRVGLNPEVKLPLSLRLAGSEISARPTQSALSLLLFGLSVCLLVFMWDLRSNIVEQINSVTSGKERPNVFVLDAPPDSMLSIQKILSGGESKNDVLSEKLTRARLISINNKNSDEWLSQLSKGSEEFIRAERLFNREQNLTSREELSEHENNEQVIAGKFWKKDSVKVPLNEVSVEAGLAKSLNLNLDDSIVFDIQGIPVKARITSIRQVRWQSFRPNFFFVMHPSTLADAPFSGLFAASLSDNKKRQEVVNSMFFNHPGVTTIDATELADLATRLLTAALEIVRFLTILLFAGAFINTVLGAWTSFSMRAQNFSLYRCLGANNSLVLRAIFGEFLVLSLAGCVVGIGSSWLLSALVQKTILTVNDQLNIALFPALVIASLVVAVCCTTAFVSTVLILRQSPFRVLRNPV